MEVTLVIDDELLDKAETITGLHDLPELLNEALLALIAREAARQLAALGGTEPDAEDIPRRRGEAA